LPAVALQEFLRPELILRPPEDRRKQALATSRARWIIAPQQGGFIDFTGFPCHNGCIVAEQGRDQTHEQAT
jgi:hypothetical protein